MNWNAFVLDSDWWTLLIRQFVQVTVLIVIAGLATRFILARRPRISRMLWVLVLLKCLTPPILALPISPFSWQVHRSESRLPPPSRTHTFSVDVTSAQQVPKLETDWQKKSDWRKSLYVAPLGTPVSAKPATQASDASEPVDSGPASPSTSSTIESASSPPILTASSWSYAGLAIAAWLLGSAVTLVVVGVQLIRFLCRVHHDRVEPRASTIQLLRKTAANMQLSGKRISRVRVQVVDSLIGPAVIGVWRPTILLPQMLETESSSTELRMLLAHELVHIRRSDVCWALVQTLASSFWWFHPLMWNVRRTFNHVTELSCDEEVIERLKCRPVEYARALLMVLEKRHQLRVAPALPGVRPVEITSTRMERVMKFERRKTSKRPWMIPLFWLTGAMLVLPGAQWATADNDLAVKSEVVRPAVPIQQEWSKIPTPAAEVDAVLDNVVQAEVATVRRHNASKAIAKILQEQPSTKEQMLNLLNAILDGVAGDESRVIMMDDHVVARASKEAHEAIQAELERIAAYGFAQQTVVSTRVCSMPKQLFDQLQIEWQLQRNEDKQEPLVTAMLDQDKVSAAIKLIQNHTAANIMMSPKVTTLDGRSAEIETGVQRPFTVTGGAKSNNEIANTTARVGRVEFEGMRLSVRPVSEGESTDLEIHLTLSKVKAVSDFTFAVAKNQAMTIQVPDVVEQSARISAAVPRAHTIAIAMPSAESPDKVIVCFVSPDSLSKHDAPSVDSVSSFPADASLTPAAYQLVASAPLPPQPALADMRKGSSSLTTWLLKADGGATPVKIMKQVDASLLPFDSKARMEGDWQMSRDGGTTKLNGKNISLSTLIPDDDVTVLRCASGSLSIEATNPSLTFQSNSDAHWDVSISDMGIRFAAEDITIGLNERGWRATGEPVNIELTIDNIGKIQGQAKQLFIHDNAINLEGDVQFTVADKILKADRVEFDVDETVAMLLRGGVHVTSKDDKQSTEIRCEGLNFGLSTGEIHLVE